jgi:hypothetical protein
LPSDHSIWSARSSALIGIDVARDVAVGRDLPAREVDRLEPRLHHLDGLAAGERAERVHVRLARHQLPELLGAAPRERVLDVDRAAQPDRVLGRVVPLDPGPARVALPGGLQSRGAVTSLSILVRHCGSPFKTLFGSKDSTL